MGEEDQIRIIIVLAFNWDDEQKDIPHPSHFPNRRDWQKALVEYRQKEIKRQTGEAIEALESLGIKQISIPMTIPITICIANKSQILNAALLDGVSSIIFDSELKILMDI